jgi:hypothetical protein
MRLGQSFKATTKIWREHDKYIIMEDICEAKYHSCPSYREFLYDSGNALLKEETNHRYWGALKADCLNWLGLIHEGIRGRFRYQYERHGRDFQDAHFAPKPPGGFLYEGIEPNWEGVSDDFRHYVCKYYSWK